MSIRVSWDSEGQAILYFRFGGEWTWTELNQQIDAAIGLSREVVHQLPTIVDVRDGVTIPGGSLFLADNLDEARAVLNRNTGRHVPIVVVGADQNTRMLYDCLRMMDSRIGWQVYFTDTLDEARAALQQHLPVLEAC